MTKRTARPAYWLAIAILILSIASCTFMVDLSPLSEQCSASEKRCEDGDICVPRDDPMFGCDKPDCTPCPFKGGPARCNSYDKCVVESCSYPWRDCDKDSSDCETNVATSADHCTECNVKACNEPRANVMTPASIGDPSLPPGTDRCGIAQCVEGYVDCNRQSADGCEAHLDDDEFTCGACGKACGVGENCEDGLCTAI